MKAIGRCPREARHVGAAKGHRSFIERINLGEDFDQGGFARAIFAEQSQDFAGFKVHADIAQGLRAAELLRHAAHD